MFNTHARVPGSMVGAIANIYKQNMIFPPPSGPGGSEDEKKQGVFAMPRAHALIQTGRNRV